MGIKTFNALMVLLPKHKQQQQQQQNFFTCSNDGSGRKNSLFGVNSMILGESGCGSVL